MRAWTVHEYGKYQDVLTWGEAEPPQPGPGEARIRITAASVSFGLILRIAGTYQVKDPLPFIPGGDVAGEVTAVGAGCECKIGQHIIGPSKTGAFADETLVDADKCQPVPANMPDDDATALLNSFMTSHLALLDRTRLKAGETLLVHGAAGGVGSAAIQIGKVLGAKVIATASSPEKLEVCRRLGADHVINYSTGDFVDEVKALTGGRGADVIYDPVGGDVFDRSTSCIAWGGRIVVIGFTSGRIPTIAVNRILLKNCAVVGMYNGSYKLNAPERLGPAQEEIFQWYAEGKIQAVISHKLPLDQLKHALELLETRKAYGKVLLAP